MFVSRSVAIMVLVAAAGVARAQVATIPFQSKEIREGRNYVPNLTAVLAVGDATGAISYSFKIDVPRGRGITPEVALEYSSNGGPSEYGWGWQLTLPTIERSERLGIPSFANSSPIYNFRNGHSTAELVHVGQRVGNQAITFQVYRERDEQSFSRYYLDTVANIWHIVRPDGERIDLATRRGPAPTNGLSGTDSWVTSQIVDSHGNYATYNYSADPYSASPVENPRLQSISYGGNSNSGQSSNALITLNWSTFWGNTVLPASYRRGYRRVFGGDQLSTIVVSAPKIAMGTSPAQLPASEPASRTYKFFYPPSAGVTTNNMFYLSSAQVESEPAIQFHYSDPAPTGPAQDTQMIWGPAPGASGADLADFPGDLGRQEVINAAPLSTSSTVRVVADLNGDGLPDIVSTKTPTNQRCNTFDVWRNTGTAFVRETWPGLVMAAGSTATLPDMCALRKVVTNASVDAETVQDFLDINGDGYPDIVYTTDSPYLLAYCAGNGHGFEPCDLYRDTQHLPISPTNAPYLRRDDVTFSNVYNTTADLLDVNSDGRPDFVQLNPSNGILSVRLNAPGVRNVAGGVNAATDQSVSGGFASAPFFIQLPHCSSTGFPFPYCLKLSTTSGSTTANRISVVDFRDVNGDGIPDFILTPLKGNVGVSFGTGTSFGAFVSLSPLQGPSSLGTGYQSGAGDYLTTSEIADLNGDGLPDLVSFDCRNNNRVVSVRFNDGGVWDSGRLSYTLSTSAGHYAFPCLAQSLMDSSHSPAIVTTTSAVLDLNGDGMPDFVAASLDSSPPPGGSFTVLARMSHYRVPRKLISATSLNGNHAMSVTYTAQTGGASPYPVHAASLVTRSRTPLFVAEPTRNSTTTTSYVYSSPTFRRSSLTFGGFGTVFATSDTYATMTVENFTTADVAEQPGLIISRTVSNRLAVGAASVEVNTYSLREVDTGHFVDDLTRREVLPGLARDIITDYNPKDDYGGTTGWTEEGDPGTADDVFHTTTYVTLDDPLILLHLPSESTSFSNSGGRVPTVRNYYDDRNNFLATPTSGLLVRQDTERDAGTFTSTQSFYDANGNAIQKIDETGYATNFTYDPTYALYQTTISDDLGTIYQSFHALTGDVSDVCGPQSSADSSTWNCQRKEEDNLGRPVAIYVSTLTNHVFALALLETISYNDSTYPLSIATLKRGVSHSVEYVDGFGNSTEVRIEETPGTFRVDETSFDGYGKPVRTELTRRETGSGYTHTPISTEATTYLYDYVNGSIELVTHPRDAGDSSAPATGRRTVYPDHVAKVDEDGHETDLYIDGFSRVSRIARLGGTLGVANSLFQYNTRGDVIVATDPNGLQTKYTRDVAGLVTSATAPDGHATSYSYDSRGRILQTVDPLGTIVNYTYDLAGRLIHVTSSNDAVGVRHVDQSIDYYSNSSIQLTTAGRLYCDRLGMWQCAENNGILARETSHEVDASGNPYHTTQLYTYTAEKKVASQASSIVMDVPPRLPGPTGKVSISYMLGGLPVAVQYPDGYVARNSYNLDDSVSGVTNADASVQLASVLYDDDGHPSSLTNSLGLEESRTYDARGRLVAVASANANIAGGDLVDDRLTLSKASYVNVVERRGLRPSLVPRATPDQVVVTNDELGRLTQVATNGSTTARYAYDLGDRLVGANETGGALGSASFTVDELTARTTGGTVQAWMYNSSGQVIQDQTLLNGTLTRLRSHAWDALGQYASTSVSNVLATQYFYTPSGAIARVIGPGELDSSTDILNVGDYARLNITTGAWSDRVLVGAKIIGEIKGPRFEMPHRTFDQSVIAVTNDLGQVVRQQEFRPYGATAAGSSGGSFEEHFQGSRQDEMVVSGGRAYDVDGVNWLTRDRVAPRNPGAFLSDSRLLNQYGMDFGNPYRWRDPSGASPLDNLLPALSPGYGVVKNLVNDAKAIWNGHPEEITVVRQAGEAIVTLGCLGVCGEAGEHAANSPSSAQILVGAVTFAMTIDGVRSIATTAAAAGKTVGPANASGGGGGGGGRGPPPGAHGPGGGPIPVLEFSRSGKNAELAENIYNAQQAGHSEYLEHGGDTDANRYQATYGIPSFAPSLTIDEYPFASSKNGGAGSWVGHVPAVQNSSQGGYLGNFLRKYNVQPGDTYRVKITP